MGLTNSFWLRGYDRRLPQTVILAGFRLDEGRRLFGSCVVAASNTNPFGVENEELRDHPDILLCRDLRMPWPDYWERFRRFGLKLPGPHLQPQAPKPAVRSGEDGAAQRLPNQRNFRLTLLTSLNAVRISVKWRLGLTMRSSGPGAGSAESSRQRGSVLDICVKVG
jgi:hypothetical protein